MKKQHLLGLFLLAPVALFLAGPRAEADVTVRLPDLPDDLDAYLREREARFADVTPGTEKSIIWRDGERAKKSLSIVYLHGFSATRMETHPLCDTVAARLDANLFYTRLTGHGRPGVALGDATVDDWVNDAVEAVEIGKRIGERVVIIGMSTGATLAAWLLVHPELRDRIAAVVMLSPNFEPKQKNARVALWPWGRQILRVALGRFRRWEPRNAEQDKFWTTVYPVGAIVTMMSLVDAVDELDFSAISTPVLMLYSEDDDTVSVDRIRERFAELAGKQNKIVAVAPSPSGDAHVIAGDIVSPMGTEPVAGEIIRFIEDVVLGESAD